MRYSDCGYDNWFDLKMFVVSQYVYNDHMLIYLVINYFVLFDLV